MDFTGIFEIDKSEQTCQSRYYISVCIYGMWAVQRVRTTKGQLVLTLTFWSRNFTFKFCTPCR